MARMRAAKTAEEQRGEGIAIAREAVEKVRPLLEGVQLSVPFGRVQGILKIIEGIKR